MSKNITKAKIGVWLITLLFVGSSIGMALFYKPPGSELKVPNKFVNTKAPSEKLKQYLLNQGISMIMFYHDAQCLQCYDLLQRFQQELSGLYPYLIIYYIESNETKIMLITQEGEKEIISGKTTDILDEICKKNVPSQVCVDYLASKF